MITAQTHLIKGGDEAYFAFDADIFSTKLKEVLKSMKHFFEYRSTKPTKAMMLGTAFHDAILHGLPYFYNKYSRLAEDHNGRTKAGKATISAIEAGGMKALSYTDWQSVLDMNKELMSHPTWKMVRSNPLEIETGFWWTHESGLKIKIKPDLLWESPSGFISCFDPKKTSKKADESGFFKAVDNFNHDIQAALYSMGLKQRFGDRFAGFYFVMVEDKGPHHGMGIYSLPDAYIETVQDWINETIWQIHEIKAKGLPVYSYSNPEINKGIIEVEMPSFMWNKYINN